MSELPFHQLNLHQGDLQFRAFLFHAQEHVQVVGMKKQWLQVQIFLRDFHAPMFGLVWWVIKIITN